MNRPLHVLTGAGGRAKKREAVGVARRAVSSFLLVLSAPLASLGSFSGARIPAHVGSTKHTPGACMNSGRSLLIHSAFVVQRLIRITGKRAAVSRAVAHRRPSAQVHFAQSGRNAMERSTRSCDFPFAISRMNRKVYVIYVNHALEERKGG